MFFGRETTYAHYGNLRDFATEMLRSELETALNEGAPLETPFNTETLTRFGTGLFEFIDRFHRNCFRLDSDKELNIAKTFQETTQDFLTSWIRQDRVSMRLFPGSTPENAAVALSWALYGGAVGWSRLTSRSPAAQAAREIVTLLLR